MMLRLISDRLEGEGRVTVAFTMLRTRLQNASPPNGPIAPRLPHPSVRFSMIL